MLLKSRLTKHLKCAKNAKCSKALPLQSRRVSYLDGQDRYIKKKINSAGSICQMPDHKYSMSFREGEHHYRLRGRRPHRGCEMKVLTLLFV
jgi:hypothetical protein